MGHELQAADHDLTDVERAALEAYGDKPKLALSTSLEFYSLFLEGATCQEIHRLNPNFPLGLIVRARIDHKWDERKSSHLNDMFDGVYARVVAVQTAAVWHLSDTLSAMHKLHGDKIKKFLQTGNKEHLEDLKLDSAKTYKDTLELLLKVTGQEKQKVAVEMVPGKAGSSVTGSLRDAGSAVSSVTGQFDAETASRLLGVLAEVVEEGEAPS